MLLIFSQMLCKETYLSHNIIEYLEEENKKQILNFNSTMVLFSSSESTYQVAY